MVTCHVVVETFSSLWFGNDHPTKIYCGLDLFEAIDHWVADKRGEKEFRVRTASGNVPFEGAECVLDKTILPWSAHFVNEKRPHDLRFNRYVDWGPVVEKDTNALYLSSNR